MIGASTSENISLLPSLPIKFDTKSNSQETVKTEAQDAKLESFCSLGLIAEEYEYIYKHDIEEFNKQLISADRNQTIKKLTDTLAEFKSILDNCYHNQYSNNINNLMEYILNFTKDSTDLNEDEIITQQLKQMSYYFKKISILFNLFQIDISQNKTTSFDKDYISYMISGIFDDIFCFEEVILKLQLASNKLAKVVGNDSIHKRLFLAKTELIDECIHNFIDKKSQDLSFEIEDKIFIIIRLRNLICKEYGLTKINDLPEDKTVISEELQQQFLTDITENMSVMAMIKKLAENMYNDFIVSKKSKDSFCNSITSLNFTGHEAKAEIQRVLSPDKSLTKADICFVLAKILTNIQIECLHSNITNEIDFRIETIDYMFFKVIDDDKPAGEDNVELQLNHIQNLDFYNIIDSRKYSADIEAKKQQASIAIISQAMEQTDDAKTVVDFLTSDNIKKVLADEKNNLKDTIYKFVNQKLRDDDFKDEFIKCYNTQLEKQAYYQGIRTVYTYQLEWIFNLNIAEDILNSLVEHTTLDITPCYKFIDFNILASFSAESLNKISDKKTAYELYHRAISNNNKEFIVKFKTTNFYKNINDNLIIAIENIDTELLNLLLELPDIKLSIEVFKTVLDVLNARNTNEIPIIYLFIRYLAKNIEKYSEDELITILQLKNSFGESYYTYACGSYTEELEKITIRILNINATKLTSAEKYELILERSNAGIPTIEIAFRLGVEENLKKYIDIILAYNGFDIDQKLSLLQAKANNNFPSLAIAFSNGNTKAIKVFIDSVLASKCFSAQQKLDLLLARNGDRKPAVCFAIENSHTDTVKIFIKTLLTTKELAIKDKVQLLQSTHEFKPLSLTKILTEDTAIVDNFIKEVHEAEIDVETKYNMLKVAKDGINPSDDLASQNNYKGGAIEFLQTNIPSLSAELKDDIIDYIAFTMLADTKLRANDPNSELLKYLVTLDFNNLIEPTKINSSDDIKAKSQKAVIDIITFIMQQYNNDQIFTDTLNAVLDQQTADDLLVIAIKNNDLNLVQKLQKTKYFDVNKTLINEIQNKNKELLEALITVYDTKASIEVFKTVLDVLNARNTNEIPIIYLFTQYLAKNIEKYSEDELITILQLKNSLGESYYSYACGSHTEDLEKITTSILNINSTKLTSTEKYEFILARSNADIPAIEIAFRLGIEENLKKYIDIILSYNGFDINQKLSLLQAKANNNFPSLAIAFSNGNTKAIKVFVDSVLAYKYFSVQQKLDLLLAKNSVRKPAVCFASENSHTDTVKIFIKTLLTTKELAIKDKVQLLQSMHEYKLPSLTKILTEDTAIVDNFIKEVLHEAEINIETKYSILKVAKGDINPGSYLALQNNYKGGAIEFLHTRIPSLSAELKDDIIDYIAFTMLDGTKSTTNGSNSALLKYLATLDFNNLIEPTKINPSDDIKAKSQKAVTDIIIFIMQQYNNNQILIDALNTILTQQTADNILAIAIKNNDLNLVQKLQATKYFDVNRALIVVTQSKNKELLATLLSIPNITVSIEVFKTVLDVLNARNTHEISIIYLFTRYLAKNIEKYSEDELITILQLKNSFGESYYTYACGSTSEVLEKFTTNILNISSKKLTDTAKHKLLLAIHNVGFPSIFIAFQDGKEKNIKKYIEIILGYNSFNLNQRFSLLQATSLEGYPGINIALDRGHVDTVKVFFSMVIADKRFTDIDKAKLLQTKDSKYVPVLVKAIKQGDFDLTNHFFETVFNLRSTRSVFTDTLLEMKFNRLPLLHVAFTSKNTKVIEIITSKIMASNLTQKDKYSILLAANNNGTPSLYHACDSGYESSITTYIRLIANSEGLEEETRVKLLQAKNNELQGTRAFLKINPQKHPRLVATFKKIIESSDKISPKGKKRIISIQGFF